MRLERGCWGLGEGRHMTESSSSVSKGAGGERGAARPYKKPLTLRSRFSFQYSQTTFIFRKSLPCRLIFPPGDLATKIWVKSGIKSRYHEVFLFAFIYWLSSVFMVISYFKSYLPGSTFAGLMFIIIWKFCSFCFLLTVSPTFLHCWLDKIWQFIWVFNLKIESNSPQMCLTRSTVSDLYLKHFKFNSSPFSIMLDAKPKQVLGPKCLSDKKHSIEHPALQNLRWLGKQGRRGEGALHDQVLQRSEPVCHLFSFVSKLNH